MRDCVLKLVSKARETKYCILRSQPSRPQNRKDFDARLSVTHSNTHTLTLYKWDDNESFKGTCRTTRVIECRISAPSGLGGTSLKKLDDGSWVTFFGREAILSVKLGEAGILIGLPDGNPSKLPERIRAIHAEIYKTKRQLSEHQGGLDRLDGRGQQDRRDSMVADLGHRIDELSAKAERLEYLRKIHASDLTCSVTYEVSGLPFVIARFDRPAAFKR